LEELRRLETEATRGPWRHNRNVVNAIDGDASVFAGVRGRRATTVASTGPGGDPQSDADAEFIAAARNKLPRILDALDAVQALAETLEAEAVANENVRNELMKQLQTQGIRLRTEGIRREIYAHAQASSTARNYAARFRAAITNVLEEEQ
jgi:hypothetical protein